MSTLKNMPKRRLLKHGVKHTPSDSPVDDYVMSVDSSEDVDYSTTVDGAENAEFFDNDTNSNEASLSQQFLSSFILNFTDEELAAKRTVETIYNASGSFSYTYRSLDEAFFAKLDGIDVARPFLKGLVSVADELVLVKYLKEMGANVHLGRGNVPPSLLSNYELVLLAQFRGLNEKVNLSMLDIINGWEGLNNVLNQLISNGVLNDLYNYLKSLFNLSELDSNLFKKCLNDLRAFVTALNVAMGSDLNGEVMKKIRKTKSVFKLVDCVNSIDVVIRLVDYLSGAQGIIIRNLLNRSESEGLVNIIKAIHDDLTGQKFITPIADGSFSNSQNISIECISTFLNDSVLNGLIMKDVDVVFCRSKFDSLREDYEQNLQKERERNAEFMRKTNFKRNAIQYVLDRIEEYNSANLPIFHKHPFFIVGLPPQNCTMGTLKKCSRKLKTLLHPDTEQDPEWKHRAEIAFKEASLALDQCCEAIATGKNNHYTMGPIPPYSTHLGLTEPPKNASPSDSMESLSGTVFPTLLLLPQFDVVSNDSKLGGLTITIDVSSINSGFGWQMLNKNRWANVYLLRPTHGDEPVAMKVSQEKICLVHKVPLPDANIKAKIPNIKFDAVQPIVFGSAWKYFVGLQIATERDSSLIKWKSIYVELSNSGRNTNQLIRLLSTYENASFIDQNLLQIKLSSNSKKELENYLLDCAKHAQRWADNN